MKPTITEIKHIKENTELCRNDLALFSEKMLGIVFHKGQIRLSREMEGEYKPVNLALCANRFGKTVMLAVKHIKKNFYKECGPGIDLSPEDWHYLDYQTLNVAPSSENTKIMLKMILQILRGEFSIREGGRLVKNRSYLQYMVDLDGLSNYKKVPDQGPYSINFANKSRFRAFTLGASHGDSIQGDKYGYASYDEFGRSKSPDKEIDDILPRLTDYNGELDIITTPDMENEIAVAYLMNKSDEIETGMSKSWRLMRGSYEENTYIPTEGRELRLEGMSDEKKRQILHGDIMLAGANYFDIRSISRVFKENLFKRVAPESGHEYWIGLDTAGAGKDYWAVTVYDVSLRPFRIVETFYDRFNQPQVNIAITKNILENFRKSAKEVNFIMDYSNEAGSIYYNDFSEFYPIKYRFGTQKITGKSTKAELLDMFRRGINAGLIASPLNKMLRNQLLLYKGPSDDEGQTTDALMSAALGAFVPIKEHFNRKTQTIFDV